MYNKIRKSFDALGSIPSLMIKHGMQLSCILLAAGLIVLLKNTYSQNYSIYMRYLSQYIVEAGVTVTAIIIIGGLMFDYYSKKNNPEE